MDNAVGLVQAYLRVNGYFTVSEYPILEASRGGVYRTVTDLDILAFRFPFAVKHPEGWRSDGRQGAELVLPDPALDITADEPDMLVGEVKEGRAVLNAAATDPHVLRAALVRFGCSSPSEGPVIVDTLLRDGCVTLASGHRLRLVAFGSTVDESDPGRYRVIRLGHVVQFLQRYLREHWDIMHTADLKDAALGTLLLVEKAVRGIARDS